VKTTIPLLRDLFADKAFQTSQIDTTYIERTWTPPA
jgi:biotin carboxylase